MMNELMYVVSICDKDGHFEPKIIANTPKLAFQKYEEFCEREQDNEHWILCIYCVSPVSYYEE